MLDHKESSPSSLKRRRSSRLKNQTAANKSTLFFEGNPRGQVTRQRRAIIDVNQNNNKSSNISIPSNPSNLSGSSAQRLERTKLRDLNRREKDLIRKEIALQARSDALDERTSSVSRKEDQVKEMMSQISRREAESALQILEEHFMCSLCYEVLAVPYTLNPPSCGHTFCALCILKWFFSRLHRACGGWHESVDCPICRNLLIITPESVPRSHATFPFVPNRVAASVIDSLLEKLARVPLTSQTSIIKREEDEDTCTSQSRKATNPECVRKREQSEEKDNPPMSDNLAVAGWKEGGNSRVEWLKRDREGKREMAHLVNHWCTMESQDFILLKQTLGV
ncbi:hypothetical protein BJ165DRAFT_1439480 [Panaeolus papilionaceus]|nr:hypothetical protein BJ165DRAFT_1439480 [Panaeolus papilionaceus]